MKTTIKQAKDHLNQDVTIGAWLTVTLLDI